MWRLKKSIRQTEKITADRLFFENLLQNGKKSGIIETYGIRL
jgi:hypothetical protein